MNRTVLRIIFGILIAAGVVGLLIWVAPMVAIVCELARCPGW